MDFIPFTSDLVFQAASADLDLLQCTNITIMDDEFLEDSETFSVELNTTDSGVTISTSVANVTIMDNDSKYIRTLYTVCSVVIIAHCFYRSYNWI